MKDCGFAVFHMKTTRKAASILQYITLMYSLVQEESIVSLSSMFYYSNPSQVVKIYYNS